MTTLELRSEIKKAVDNVPEDLLEDLLQTIKNFQHSEEDARLDSHFQKVMKENREVLKKLAE